MKNWKFQRTPHKAICVAILAVIALVLALPLPASAQTVPDAVETDIVFVIDVSGSMSDEDPNAYARNALRLGVDLSPNHSRVGMVAVNDHVVSEFPLTDVSTTSGRAEAKAYINRLNNDQNTNFTPGIQAGIYMLAESTAERKRLIFLGDIKEGGHNSGGTAAETAETLALLTGRAGDMGIAVDMLLMGQAPENSAVAARLTAMPGATGGNLYEYASASRLPAYVEEIYFGNYAYFQTIYTLRGESSQTLQIPMPTDQVQRARIYVSASDPVASFGASYAGAALNGETTRSYSIVDLELPSRDGLSVTLTPGTSGAAYVYLLLEYDMELAVSLASELENPDTRDERQVSAITAEIVDTETGLPLLSPPFGENVAYTVTVTDPHGGVVTQFADTDETTFVLHLTEDEDFGKYTVAAALTVGDFTFTPAPVPVDVQDIRTIPDPINWPLIIALCIAALLIGVGSTIAHRHKKQEAEFQGAVEMKSDYRFHGKLAVYGVVLEGGNREMRPFDFGIYTLDEKKVTLRQILDSSGAKETYPGAEHILFLVGPEESLIIRNNSPTASIRTSGRDYGFRSKLQIWYTQKIYIIFEKDENELEITYRKSSELEPAAPLTFNFKSRTVN